jgi:hypothetical protein
VLHLIASSESSKIRISAIYPTHNFNLKETHWIRIASECNSKARLGESFLKAAGCRANHPSLTVQSSAVLPRESQDSQDRHLRL